MRRTGFRHFGEVNFSHPRPVVHCDTHDELNQQVQQHSFMKANESESHWWHSSIRKPRWVYNF